MAKKQPQVENGIRVKAQKVLRELKIAYPSAKTGLDYGSPFELLIATILSAQCTDVRVNKITKELFKHANTPEKILQMGQSKLISFIRGAGLYQNKSKSILATCERLLNEYSGQVPATRKALETLPGVGRKTANVVLANAFNIPALPVDTHVYRISKRIGLAEGSNPFQVEQELMAVIPEAEWNTSHHLLIYHGRNRCKAKSPDCKGCEITSYCRYYDQLWS